jgi:beta-mannosidase
VLASQISQAEADKFFIELSRMRKWQRTGILWWNLRDGWPIISDAVVDYYGRKSWPTATSSACRPTCAPCAASPRTAARSSWGQRHAFACGRPRDHARRDSGSVLFEADYRVERNGRTVAGSVPPAARRRCG